MTDEKALTFTECDRPVVFRGKEKGVLTQAIYASAETGRALRVECRRDQTIDQLRAYLTGMSPTFRRHGRRLHQRVALDHRAILVWCEPSEVQTQREDNAVVFGATAQALYYQERKASHE